MRRFFFSDTAYGTRRLWVERDPDGLIGVIASDINPFAIWKGADKVGENFASWEIKPEDEGALKSHLCDASFRCATFQPSIS